MSSKSFLKRAGRSRFLDRSLALLMALVLLLALLPGLEPAADAAYYDEAIQKLIGWNVLRGYPDGSLNPDSNITRAEFVALINRAYGYDELTAIPFIDVPDDAWFHDDISAAYAAGYFNGTSDNTASPSGELTREQALVLLARNMRLDAGSGEVTSFSDGHAFQSYSAGYANTAVKKGLVSGYSDGSFQPSNSITRGEMAVMLSRALGNLITGEGTYVLGDVFGNVTINSSNVTLRNTTIAGDLYLTGGLGLGGVTLENVRVLGDIIVAGGGESDAGESVILRNVTADSVVVDTLLGEYVSLRAEGDTNIARALLISDAYLQDRTPAGMGFKTIEMTGAGGAYTLSGNLEKVVNAAPGSTLRISQGIVRDLNMDEAAVGASLWLDSNATVQNLTLDTATAVTGRGDVRKLNVNVAGSSTEMLPDDITVRPGLTGNIAGETMDTTAAAEASSDPRILADSPQVINVAATTATATFATNKSGTIYWAITTISDGSVNAESLLAPASQSRILRSGNLRAAQSNTTYSAALTGLTTGGSYYLTAMLVDARGDYSPIKVVSFTTTDNTVPAFGSGFPTMSRVEKSYAEATVMASKDCQLYWVVFDKGSAAPTAASFRAGAFTGSYGYGIMDMKRNITETFQVNNLGVDLKELQSYDIYFWLNDPDSAKSSAVKKLTFTTPDRTPPKFVTEPYTTYIAATSLRLTTSLNEAGTVFWVIVESGEDYPKQPTTDITELADFDAYFKLQIANGMNGLKAGSINVRPNADATINITGLQAETEYKIYYIARDNAGNYSEISEMTPLPAGGYRLDSNHIYQSTLDTHGPTVRQDFTRKLDDTHPLADTNIRIIFSERVQYHNILDNYFEPLDEAFTKYRDLKNASADKDLIDDAAKEYAALLRKVILLYGGDNELVKERTWDPLDTAAKDYGGNDWVIDYRNATVTMDGREMVVTFPTVLDEDTEMPGPDSALNLNSDATYRFSIIDVTDTYVSPNKIEPNPYPLDSFTTVAAQALLKGADLSPKEITYTYLEKASGGADDEGVKYDTKEGKIEVDTLFSLTPSSVSRADPTKCWDMLIWSEVDVELELYMKPVKKNADTGSPGPDGWKLVQPVLVEGAEAKANNQITFRTDFNGQFMGLSFWQKLRGAGYNPHIRHDTLSEDQISQGFFGLEDDTIYYFAIRLRRIEDMARDDYTGSIDLWITVNTGDNQDLSTLVNGTLNEARYNRDFKDKTVSEISTSLSVDENGHFIRKATFTETAAPDFMKNFPQIEYDDTWAKVSLQLERTGTVYYVLAPADGTSGSLNTVRKYRSVVDFSSWEDKDAIPKDLPKDNAYEAESRVVFGEYDIPVGNDEYYYGTPEVVFYDGTTALNEDNGYVSWYPLYLSTPTNRDVFNPRSEITGNPNNQTGSVPANNVSTAYIELDGLEPSKPYFLYLVVVGDSGIPSPYAQLYQFQTNAANRPDVDVSRPQPHVVTITSDDMDATTNYVLLNLNSLSGTILGKTFATPEVMDADKLDEFTTKYGNTEDSEGNNRGEYTVAQAIQNRPGSNDSLDSFFDQYASTTFKRQVREFVSTSIPSGTVAAVGTIDLTEDVTETLDCLKEFGLDLSRYYFLTVSRYQHIPANNVRNLSEDSYSFRAQSPIFVSDNEPPQLSQIGGDITVNFTTKKVTGDITLTFDAPLYYLKEEGSTEKYRVHEYKSKATDTTSNITYMSTKSLAVNENYGITVSVFDDGDPDDHKFDTTNKISLKIDCDISDLAASITFVDGHICKEFSEVLGILSISLDLESIMDGCKGIVNYTPPKGSTYSNIWMKGYEDNIIINVRTTGTPPVQNIALSQTSLTMTKLTADLSATVTFQFPSSESLVGWSSNSDAVAISSPTTTDTTGGRAHGNHKVTLTAQHAGIATITATSLDDPTKTVTCVVTVDATAVPAALINQTGLTLSRGQTETLTYTLGVPDEEVNYVTWVSDNTDAVTVGIHDGTVRGLAEGAAEITLTVRTRSGKDIKATTTVYSTGKNAAG